MAESERESLRQSLRVPAWCPICQLVMKGGAGGDDQSYFRWGCCRLCHIEFVEDREDRWKGGWRPTSEDLQRYFTKMGWGDAPKSD